MQQINKDYDRPNREVGKVIEKADATKRRLTRTILNNTGIFVGFFLIFVVIVVFTTEIKITSFEFWAQLGLTFFVLFFCSYSMYVNCADSGIKAGRSSEVYTTCKKEYDDLKKSVVDKKYQARITEFCRYYIDRELRETRTNILNEVGIDYDKYVSDYCGRDKKLLEQDETLSKSMIAAILKANKAKPVTLTPEMIFKRGRGIGGRHPLGTKPETKRTVYYVTKFVRTLITSVLTGVIVLDVIKTPTWATFAACLLKLMPVILNGVMGYRMGYINIAVDTVDYINDQKDLLRQLIEYAETVPPQETAAAAPEQTPPVEQAQTEQAAAAQQ